MINKHDAWSWLLAEWWFIFGHDDWKWFIRNDASLSVAFLRTIIYHPQGSVCQTLPRLGFVADICPPQTLQHRQICFHIFFCELLVLVSRGSIFTVLDFQSKSRAFSLRVSVARKQNMCDRTVGTYIQVGAVFKRCSHHTAQTLPGNVRAEPFYRFWFTWLRLLALHCQSTCGWLLRAMLSQHCSLLTDY